MSGSPTSSNLGGNAARKRSSRQSEARAAAQRASAEEAHAAQVRAVRHARHSAMRNEVLMRRKKKRKKNLFFFLFCFFVRLRNVLCMMRCGCAFHWTTLPMMIFITIIITMQMVRIIHIQFSIVDVVLFALSLMWRRVSGGCCLLSATNKNSFRNKKKKKKKIYLSYVLHFFFKKNFLVLLNQLN
jgi:hypothetical protein